MAPKHALLSSSGPGAWRGTGKTQDSCFRVACILNAGFVAVCSPRNGSRSRVLNGMLSRVFVTISAVLILMMQSCEAADAAEADHYLSVQQADSPLDPTLPPSLIATPWLRDRAPVKDKDAPVVGPEADLGPWPEGKVFAEARTAVWTGSEAGVRAPAGGKVFAGAGIMTETRAWAEAGWRPVEAERDVLPSIPGDPAPMLGRETGEDVQREDTAFSSVLSLLTETSVLQTPIVRKPIGLLSKAAWTKTLSPSSSKASSSTAKASSSPSSSSSAAPSSKIDNQTAATTNTSVVPGNNSSSSNNSFEESVSSLPAWDLPTVPESLLSTVGDHDITLPANITSPFSTHQWNTTMPIHPRTSSQNTTTAATTIKTSPSPTATTSTPSFPTTVKTPPETTTVWQNTSKDAITSDSLKLTTVTTTTPSTTTLTVMSAEVTTQVPTNESVVTPPGNATTTTIAQETTRLNETTTTPLPTTTTTPTTTVPPTTTTTTTTTPAPTTTTTASTTTTTTPTTTTTTTTRLHTHSTTSIRPTPPPPPRTHTRSTATMPSIPTTPSTAPTTTASRRARRTAGQNTNTVVSAP
uniref:KIAA1549-like a n=1 Tax=Iconisemion striatum TaxID=60296 RepID=A0A1A7YWT8_9TELE